MIAPVPVPTDADMLRTAVEDAASILQAFVGQSPIEFDADGLVMECDPAKRGHVMVDREKVPEILWRGAIRSLDMLMLTLAFTDSRAPLAQESVEAQAAAFLRARGTL